MIIEAKDIVVGLPDAPRLGPISFHASQGETVALLGPNGAGKTTLLRLLMGLERLTSGQLLFDGAPWPTSPQAGARKGLGYSPEGRRVFPGLTTEENLLAVSDEPKRQRQEQVDEMYRLFPRLAERRAAEAWRLSGGEQQMLAIARALMGRPRLLLLDEPSLGLAPKLTADLFEAITGIANSGISILIAEQNIGRAIAIADRAMILAGGRLVAEGPPSRFGDPQAVASAYFDGA